MELRIASSDGVENKRIRSDNVETAFWPRDWSRDGKYRLCERYGTNAARALAIVTVDSFRNKKGPETVVSKELAETRRLLPCASKENLS